MNKKNGISSARFITVTGMLGAVAFVLMYFEFAVPFMPSFIKMDISDLPALVGAFAMGPLCGTLVEVVKIVLKLLVRGTTTGFVGEFSNLILGIAFVVPAGWIYKVHRTKKGALAASFIGAAVMGVLSVITNYWVVYPVYYNFMPQEVILAAYQAIVPSVKSILQCLIVFNMPFTFVKGLLSVVITLFIYKPLSPLLKGRE